MRTEKGGIYHLAIHLHERESISRKAGMQTDGETTSPPATQLYPPSYGVRLRTYSSSARDSTIRSGGV